MKLSLCMEDETVDRVNTPPHMSCHATYELTLAHICSFVFYMTRSWATARREGHIAIEIDLTRSCTATDDYQRFSLQG